VLLLVNHRAALSREGRGHALYFVHRSETGANNLRTKTYRLIGADGRSYESETKGALGGNRRLKIYGRLDCPSALRAIRRGGPYPRHRVFFADEAGAIAAGFRPCGVCMREAYRRWRAAEQKNRLSARPNSKQTAYEPNKKS
jgi:methylphosphotriester-DNA--protein-cysteine methyltransferase